MLRVITLELSRESHHKGLFGHEIILDACPMRFKDMANDQLSKLVTAIHKLVSQFEADRVEPDEIVVTFVVRLFDSMAYHLKGLPLLLRNA